jgi:prophage maintenance system killer protein
MFCALNGYDLNVPTDDVVTMVLAVAAGEMGEESLADWIANRLSSETI